MVYVPKGSFQHAIQKIPLMKVAYRIGLFIRNFMVDESQISAGKVIERQMEIFEDFAFAESFEVIMLLFMLSRFDYLDHIDRDQGYVITDKLLDEFPLLDDWQDEHPVYNQLIAQLDCEDKSLEILFRRLTWIDHGNFLSLDLNDLFIEELDADVFTSFHFLQEIYLNNNLLGTLPSGIFDTITDLRVIDLSYNMITELPVYLFSNNHQLTKLNLSRNGIDERWIKKFKAFNRLTHGNIEIIT